MFTEILWESFGFKATNFDISFFCFTVKIFKKIKADFTYIVA